MKWIKSSDFNQIVEIIIWARWELRDTYFLAELFLKSWFDRSTIKFLLNLCETEIDFTAEILRKYCKSDDFLRLLQNIAENLLSENEKDAQKLQDIVSKYSEKSDETTTKTKENPALRVTEFLHQDVQSIFASGIKIKKYDWLVLEGFNIINDKLNRYCVDAWLGDVKESEAINKIFSSDKNPFALDLTTDTWKSIQDWLQNLFNGIVKFYRNPIAHGKYIKSEREFIEAMTLISMLLYKIDASDIGKQDKKQKWE